MDFLMKASAEAQFFAFGEEHNVKEVPAFTSLLFGTLHERYGYNYLAEKGYRADPSSDLTQIVESYLQRQAF